MIKCRVTGECSFCKFDHNETETFIIQADGKYIYSMENVKKYGYAQCINCAKPLPWESFFPDFTPIRG